MTAHDLLVQAILRVIVDAADGGLSAGLKAEVCRTPALLDQTRQLIAAVASQAAAHHSASGTTDVACTAQHDDERRTHRLPVANMPTQTLEPHAAPSEILAATARQSAPANKAAPGNIRPDGDSVITTQTPAEAVAPSEHSTTASHGKPPLWKLMPYYHFDLPDAPTVSLKPGQIPAAGRRPAVDYTTPLPTAHITVANARAGEAFDSPLFVALDNGLQADIVDVQFARDIGLHFDKQRQVLTGTPQESGDFAIAVHWACASHPVGVTQWSFIVNPDPKSLWKVVEPPADAPYRKAHIDHSGIARSGAHIAAASRRGRSHEHAGSFLDDDFYINHSEETGWCLMLVADGTGSAAHSREGSRIAVTTAGHYLYNQLSGQQGSALKTLIASWDDAAQNATKSALLHAFQQAARLAANSNQNEAICRGHAEKTYATTLLATVSLRLGDELFAAAFWLGDGAIAAYGPAGKVRVLGSPDSGEYAGQTRFLDRDIIEDPSFHGRISVGKWRDVSHLILMTDGVSDPWFETDNGLRRAEKWDALLEALQPCLAADEQASARLAEWLSFFSPGNHDDRTIAVSW